MLELWATQLSRKSAHHHGQVVFDGDDVGLIGHALVGGCLPDALLPGPLASVVLSLGEGVLDPGGGGVDRGDTLGVGLSEGRHIVVILWKTPTGALWRTAVGKVGGTWVDIRIGAESTEMWSCLTYTRCVECE